MKEIEINVNKVKRLIISRNEEMFENLADEIARDNNINIQIAKIILAFDEMELYEWVYMSKTRIIFYIDNKYADVYNIQNKWIDRYEDGLRMESFNFENYIKWSAYRNEVMC